MAKEFKLSYTANDINTRLGKIDSLANKSELPTKTSDLTNDSGYLTSYTETDPTVPSWAKAATKPTYTASEVGADASGTASSAVSAHNANTSAHADIREQIDQLFSEKLDKTSVLQNTGNSETDVMSQKAVTAALENLTTLPYGGSKEWLENNGDVNQLYQIDGYVWGYIESTGWTKSGTQFLVVSSESEMTNNGGTEYLLRRGNEGTVYTYTEASGDSDVSVVDSIPDTANNGDIITVKPTEVSSIAEMVDTSKQYAMDGKVWEYGEVEVEKEPENRFVPANATLNKRLSSSGESGSNGMFITEYLEFDASTATSSIIWLPTDWASTAENQRVLLADANKAKLSSYYIKSNMSSSHHYVGRENGRYYVDISKDNTGSTMACYASTKYIRIGLSSGVTTSITAADIADVEILFEKDRGVITQSQWVETDFSVGRKYEASVTTKEVPNYTNLADPTSSDWIDDVRLNSSGTTTDNAGTTATNYISAVKGDVIRVKGLDMTASTARIAMYKSDKSVLFSTTMSSTSYVTDKSLTVELSSFKLAFSNDTAAFVRFSAPLTGNSADVIITKNEEITTKTIKTTNWEDIGAYTAPTEAGWDATEETHEVIDSLSAPSTSGDSAVYSGDGYLYSYIIGAAWMQSSKYSAPTLSIDGELSSTSTNAVQNAIVTAELDVIKAKTNSNASEINSINTRIANIETGSDTVTIPTFWEDAVAEVITKIKALQVGRNCVTFPFFSDNHQRNGYAGILISHIMKACNIPYCFFGGDSISNGYIDSEETMIAQDKAFDTIMSYIPNGRLCRAVGNHDGYWNVSSATGDENHYTDAQIYELFMREESIAQNKHFGGDGTYYYVDDIASRVRWIVLDTNDGIVENEQLTWLQNTALSFSESGWAIVFISHQPISNHYHALISNAAEVRTIVTSYMNGNSANKADVVGWYSGHIHRDRIYTGIATNTKDDTEGDAMGFTQVTITSDHTSIAYDDATKHTVAADDQSHAIDFVTINKSTRTVNITRLGIGEDRSYSY